MVKFIGFSVFLVFISCVNLGRLFMLFFGVVIFLFVNRDDKGVLVF